MEGLLRSLGSPRLHAPLRSCLKQGENTLDTGNSQRNVCSPNVPPTAFDAVNTLAETGRLSLLCPYSGALRAIRQ